jgi:hypothetical protein
MSRLVLKRSRFAALSAFSALSVLGSSVVHAQVRSVTIGPATARFAEPFSQVVAVREQSNGEVLVLDGIDLKILRVNLRSGASATVGRSGRGPGEYTLPLSLLAWRGDSTLAVDMTGGGRALLITSAGASGSSLPMARSLEGRPLFMRPDVRTDSLGRIYELVMRNPSAGAAEQGVRRVDRGSGRQDTLGQLSLRMRSPLVRPPSGGSAPRAAGASSGGMEVRRAGGAPPPFFSIDQWAVAADGRIAFVTVNPYRVSYINADGSRVEGPEIAFTPVPISDGLKAEWREAMSQPVPAIMSSGQGQMSAGRMPSRFVEPEEWPRELPPFLRNALRFAPDGMLLIERAMPAGSPQTFDVVDARGQLTTRVTLPPRTRLVGFGKDGVYTVRIDEDDLEHLQFHSTAGSLRP